MSSVDDILPNGWKETTLGEVAFFQRGFDLPKKDREKGDYPLMVSNGQDETHKEFKVKAPGIVTGRSGSLGNVFYVDKDFWPLNTTLWIKEFYSNNVKFIYYLLKIFPFERYNSGSGVPTLNRNHIHPLSIKIPSNIQEQKAIANVLTAFDDKIENLRAQNQTLEQTAQTIFKEWFGKYQIGDELPDGWSVGEINDLVEFVIDNRGKTPPLVDESIDSHPLIEVNSITGDDRNINLSVGKKFVDEKTYQNWFRKGHPINGDILLSTVGSIGQLAQVFDEKITVAQNIVALRSNTSGNFLYELLKRNQKLIINLDISSVQPSIKVPHLLSMPVVIPVLDLIQQFDKVVDKLTIKITSNNKQIQTLTQTRDALLPKLMRGEIRVNGFKK
ncbi:restriction endonuclease subunit S [Winogradskyella litoriviva]|uniref:Restriction endonuclease subunit S n=1 Tax=Winogradskyella litoriviva TaxID=1220182 RepID=A0ABX2E2Q2_9FLAO|nr:restriction endonuclease subunit S [Winogradskyella litoriviva]NRD22707.1 restriction endonuclease subunit S [Winogradskyella litoriviva]